MTDERKEDGSAIDAAAEDLKLPAKDWRVPRYAILMVAHQRIQAAIATGQDYDIDQLLKIEAAMQEIRSSLPPEPIKVGIEIIGGTDDEHEYCHAPGCHGDIIKICICCGRIPGEDPHRPSKRPPPQLTARYPRQYGHSASEAR